MKMVAQYNNVTTQNRMRQYLQNLKLSSVMEKENCDVTAGLENLRTQINKFTPLGPPNYRFDESKVEYMYEAVVGHSWAASALTNCFSCDPPWNFDKFCSALNAAWLQEHVLFAMSMPNQSRRKTRSRCCLKPSVLMDNRIETVETRRKGIILTCLTYVVGTAMNEDITIRIVRRNET